MISSIVLAAGSSTRMGAPKAMLDWDGEALIAYQVHRLKDAGADEVIVVLGYKANEIHRMLGKLPCRVMVNPRFHGGRAGSLRIGAKAVDRDADAIIVANVDQPRTASFYAELIAQHQPESAATLPSHEGRHGHPVIVAGRLREELMAATDTEEGLKGVLRNHQGELREYEAGDLALLDINTPDEYEQARKRFSLER